MKLLRPLLVSFLALSCLTGLLYPLAVSGIGQVAFSDQVNGSLIIERGEVVGSRLIGQNFSAPEYFWGRPSASATFAYNGMSSGGSNLGPTNPALKVALEERIKALRAADPSNSAAIPVDLMTASGSGLDPEISPAAAAYQIARVARARGRSPAQITALVAEHSVGPQLGWFGEARVNVLELNLALNKMR